MNADNVTKRTVASVFCDTFKKNIRMYFMNCVSNGTAVLSIRPANAGTHTLLGLLIGSTPQIALIYLSSHVLGEILRPSHYLSEILGTCIIVGVATS